MKKSPNLSFRPHSVFLNYFLLVCRAEVFVVVFLALWLLLQLLIILSFGVALGGDSSRYIESGLALTQGGELAARSAPYLSYIGIIALSFWLGVELYGVVIFQVFIAAVALWAVFDLARSVAGAWAGFFAMLPVATFFDYFQWHRYIFTDSFSASLTVITVWLLWKMVSTRKSFFYFAVLPILLVGALMRPNGWLMLFLAVFVVSVTHFSTLKGRFSAIAAGFFLILSMITLTPSYHQSLSAEMPANQTLRGMVVWGAEETYLDMPQVELKETGYRGVVQYALTYPASYVNLMTHRAAWHVVKYRPWFSNVHNAYIIAYIIPVYFFAVWGVVCFFRHPVILMCVLTFLLKMSLVMITFANWEGRFSLYAWPLVSVCFGVGFSLFLTRLPFLSRFRFVRQ